MCKQSADQCLFSIVSVKINGLRCPHKNSASAFVMASVDNETMTKHEKYGSYNHTSHVTVKVVAHFPAYKGVYRVTYSICIIILETT